MPSEIFDPTRTSDEGRVLHSSPNCRMEELRGFMYAQADGAISVGAVCIIDTDGTADEGTATLAATHSGCAVGVAQTAIADDESYGWLQTRRVRVRRSSRTEVLTVGESIWFGATAGALSDTDDCVIPRSMG